uniref:Uncharacterized protein n=1 Tax=Lepeophtheirus salmonis TaxID=72036 RepID=A0A0K2TDR3_LEPSM
MKSIRDFCTKILETESKIHVLINNNVIQWASKRTTEDGFELHWGINHMSNFVMTQLLLPLLHRAAPDARIINMTSSWYSRSKGINWNDPNFRNESYSACEAFNQSKLANILFTRELSKRLEGTGVNVKSLNLCKASGFLSCRYSFGIQAFRKYKFDQHKRICIHHNNLQFCSKKITKSSPDASNVISNIIKMHVSFHIDSNPNIVRFMELHTGNVINFFSIHHYIVHGVPKMYLLFLT